MSATKSSGAGESRSREARAVRAGRSSSLAPFVAVLVLVWMIVLMVVGYVTHRPTIYAAASVGFLLAGLAVAEVFTRGDES